MTMTVDKTQLAQLNDSDPEYLLRWAWDMGKERAAILTSLQNTGSVMIDMARRVAPELRVAVIDTLRMPRETYALIDAFEERYGITIERFKPDPERLAMMVNRHGEYLFFDSREKQEFCCRVRKVEPNQRALDTVDVWITGLRRDQSEKRMATPKAGIVVQRDRKIIKLCPLADWTEEAVWSYIQEHDVPYNPLYDTGYTSIGCEVCTTPTLPGEEKRAGRWRWMNQLEKKHDKECGLHIDGAGI